MKKKFENNLSFYEGFVKDWMRFQETIDSESKRKTKKKTTTKNSLNTAVNDIKKEIGL